MADLNPMPAPPLRIGDTLRVYYSFRLPDGGLIKVTFEATVEAEEDEQARFWVRLGAWRDLEWQAGHAREEHIVEKLNALVGKRAKIPQEATTGTRLPMKYRTLTREMRYFYD